MSAPARHWRWLAPGLLTFLLGTYGLFVGSLLMADASGGKGRLLTGVFLFAVFAMLALAGWFFLRCFGSSKSRINAVATYIVGSIISAIGTLALLSFVLGILVDLGVIRE